MTYVYLRVTCGWHTSTHQWRTNDIRVSTSGIRIYTSDIRMIYDYIRVTYEWHMYTYEGHTDEIQVHTDDIRVHTIDIRMTCEYIRMTYAWYTGTCKWHTDDMRFERKINLTFLNLFDNPLSKYPICKRIGWFGNGCIGLFTKIKKGSWISFWWTFSAWFFWQTWQVSMSYLFSFSRYYC